MIAFLVDGLSPSGVIYGLCSGDWLPYGQQERKGESV